MVSSKGCSTQAPVGLNRQPWGDSEFPILNDANREIDATMRTIPIKQAEGATPVFIEHKLFAQDHQLLGAKRRVLELLAGRDGMPVSPQEMADRRPWTHSAEGFVILFTEHWFPHATPAGCNTRTGL